MSRTHDSAGLSLVKLSLKLFGNKEQTWQAQCLIGQKCPDSAHAISRHYFTNTGKINA